MCMKIEKNRSETEAKDEKKFLIEKLKNWKS